MVVGPAAVGMAGDDEARIIRMRTLRRIGGLVGVGMRVVVIVVESGGVVAVAGRGVPVRMGMRVVVVAVVRVGVVVSVVMVVRLVVQVVEVMRVRVIVE